MQASLHRKARMLSYLTVGYNLIEGVLSVGAGLLSGSISLIGFGLDSFVESLSGSVMIWRFWDHKNMTEEQEEKIEKRAIQLVSATFFTLGVYVFYESAKDLLLHEPPEPSMLGIVIAIFSLLIMPTLFYMKYQTGKALQSKSLVADSKQTLICVFMSFALLLGLGMNYLYGIWWLDPLVGLIIAMLLFREGYSAYREQKLCSC